MLETLQAAGIIPLIKMDKTEHALPLSKALQKGGLPLIEVTFRSEAALDSIRIIAKEAKDVLVCAGTVLNLAQAKAATEAGAKAIISPGYHLETIKWCQHNNIPIIPGCATPTELEALMREGLSLVKLFPAEVLGGVSMLKALSGPYPDMMFMPTGGISPENVTSYLSQKNVAACGGSWVVPWDLLTTGQFDEIEKLAKEAVNIRDKARV